MYSCSLRTWADWGILDRELALYRKLQEKNVRVSIVSYGGKEEYDYQSRMPDIQILCNWIGWKENRYARRLHQLHGLQLLKSQIYKTDQMIGADAAVRASRAWQTPLVVRMGYDWSYNASQIHWDEPDYLKRVEEVHRDALQQATQVVVTTQDISERMIEKVPSVAEKLSIFPNFVDTEMFKPDYSAKLYDLVFVGHMIDVKNVHALLQAVASTEYSIAMIGDGKLHKELQEEFSTLDGRIHWFGRVSNPDLPQLLNQARAFVLPSLFEGQPRVMLEAMACGMPIIGSNVPGINNLIKHGVTGYLCDTDEKGIAIALGDVLSQPELMRALGNNARRYALDHFSLDSVAEREYKSLERIALEHPMKSKTERIRDYLLRRV